jgi:hypothetical protein
MKALESFLLFAVMVFGVFSSSFASDSSTACFDLGAGFGKKITHILIDSGFGASASDFAITVDGEPVGELHTDGGPCEDIPRDVWFLLEGGPETAFVCVTVQGEESANIEVFAKVNIGEIECIQGTQ